MSNLSQFLGGVGSETPDWGLREFYASHYGPYFERRGEKFLQTGVRISCDEGSEIPFGLYHMTLDWVSDNFTRNLGSLAFRVVGNTLHCMAGSVTKVNLSSMAVTTPSTTLNDHEEFLGRLVGASSESGMDSVYGMPSTGVNAEAFFVAASPTTLLAFLSQPHISNGARVAIYNDLTSAPSVITPTVSSGDYGSSVLISSLHYSPSLGKFLAVCRVKEFETAVYSSSDGQSWHQEYKDVLSVVPKRTPRSRSFSFLGIDYLFLGENSYLKFSSDSAGVVDFGGVPCTEGEYLYVGGVTRTKDLVDWERSDMAYAEVRSPTGASVYSPRWIAKGQVVYTRGVTNGYYIGLARFEKKGGSAGIFFQVDGSSQYHKQYVKLGKPL